MRAIKTLVASAPQNIERHAVEPAENEIIEPAAPLTWTQEQSIAYEVAIGAIDSTIAIYSAEIWKQEKESINPDKEYIEWLTKRLSQCSDIRKSLHITSDIMIKNTIREFSAIIKSYK